MRFVAEAYRAHDPRWSFKPLSGDGASIHGGRFNPKRVAALYLALDPMTAIKEAAQGFPLKIEPLLLCSYSIDCENIIDLTDRSTLDELALDSSELSGGWLLLAKSGKEPPTWRLAARLMASGAAGLIAPSYAPGAGEGDRNLVLWRWGPDLPHRVDVHDPSGRLPKSQLSWA